MTSSDDKEKDAVDDSPQVDTSRRDFLKVAMTLSAIMAFGGIGTVLKAISNPAPPGTRILTFPRVKVADASVAVGSPVFFNYPLDNEPNFLVRIGQKAAGGVGNNQDIVAFSQICQHWGCESISYQAQSKYGVPVAYCSCHGSTFDMLNSAAVRQGPALLPLPQVQLEVDSSGNIYAKGMGPPVIYGHTGSDYVSADLSNGNPVG